MTLGLVASLFTGCSGCDQAELFGLSADDTPPDEGDAGSAPFDAGVRTIVDASVVENVADAGMPTRRDAGGFVQTEQPRPLGEPALTPECPPGMSLCGGICVDLARDALHCGTCARVCDDGNACNGAEMCNAGSCTHGTAPDCDDGNPCTADACDPSGACVHHALADGTECASPGVCSTAAACQAGVCGAPGALNCDDGNPCTADACDGHGGCTHEPARDGIACGDGNACNGAEVCRAGTCSAGTAPNCDDGNPCTADACDGARGCTHTVVTEGTSCDDRNVCNGTAECRGAQCTPRPAPSCDDGNACSVDACDPVRGCTHNIVPDGIPCFDGNACNGTEMCRMGSCTGGTPLDCDDGNPCTADACDPSSGCTHEAVVDGTSCSDANACNGAEACIAGSCRAGTAPRCDDGNPCTSDRCDAAVGCMHLNVLDGVTCSDGNACNGAEMCSRGACSAGTALDCDDGNPCTADACDAASGCTHDPVPDGTDCGDLDACNGAEVCSAGTCAAGSALHCDDGNPCTADLCDPTHGCTVTPLPEGTSCSDGIACNGAETCQLGACMAGLPQPCQDDGNPCTADVCGAQGCEHRPWHDDYPCSDNRACNGQELCENGVCTPGTAPTCDDNNTCTAESCSNSDNRCLYTNVADGTPCDDGDPATINDQCRAGVCGVGLGTHRVNELPGNVSANSHSGKPFLSEDGLWVAFQSEATNLVPGDTNVATDVFVSSVATGLVQRVSVSATGEQAQGFSRLGTPNDGLAASTISGDDRFIVFSSNAANLVGGDTNQDWDVFVKDRISGAISRASVHSSGVEAVTPLDAARWNRFATLSGEGTISQDGRYVVFSSYAPNLVDGDTNNLMDVFRHDRITGATELVSVSSVGVQGNGDSDMPSVSGDGRCIAFRTLAGNINDNPAEPDSNYQYDIYVRDMAAHTTRRISTAFDGTQPNDVNYYPRINSDCTLVTWVSWASNLVPGDTNGTLDLFARDLDGGPIIRVNTTSTGAQANLRTGGPASVNKNGRYVAFYSWATNFVAEDNNLSCSYVAVVNSRNCIDIFIKDLWTGEIRRGTLTAGGQQTLNNNQDPSISGDGSVMAFGSYARNLDPDKTTGFEDIFVVLTRLAPSL